MATDLIVLIATAGRPDLLERTLRSLQSCRRPASYRGTIVVENGPKRGAESVAANFLASLGVRYLHSLEPNKSRALNVAIESLPDSLVYFTDDDVRLHSDILCTYEGAASAHGHGYCFGGPTGVDYEIEPSPWLKEFMPASARGWWLDGGQQNIREPAFLGFNWAAFTSDLRKAGPFNGNFGPGALTGSVGQDTEMQMRLLRLGFKGIYLPEAFVWHYVPAARSSERWTIGRAYRHGVRHGLMESNPHWPRILGFPRWTCRALVARTWGVIREGVCGNEKSRFRSLHEWNFMRGYMKGAGLARRLRTAPQSS